MKIYVNARFLTQPVSGVQRYGIECSRQIKKLRPDTVFLAPKNVLHKDIAEELGAKIIGINTGHLWEQADLPLYLAGQKHPPLFNPANTGPMLYSNNYITLHDLAFYHHPEWNSKAFSTWYNVLIPRLAISCKHLFTVSGTMRDEIIEYYKIPQARISVTYNGIAGRMMASAMPAKPKEKIILSVGTFNKRKNHQNLVRAFLESKVKDEYQLVIIGDRNKVFSESSLDDQELKKGNIKIYEHLTADELIGMYEKAEVVVSLSLYEGFGVPVLEGLYYGCKALCSDIKVYRELYEEYATFCDPLNIKEIAGSLEEIVMKAPVSSDVRTALTGKYNYERSAQIIVDTMVGQR